MNKLVIACMMCLAVVCGASAGYTDTFWNESEERVYYDCGDWSGVDNHKDTSLKVYRWTYEDDFRPIFNPRNHGLPNDVKFITEGVCGDVAWTFMDVRGYDKTLHYGEDIYTDDPTNINYICGYIKVYYDNPPNWGVRSAYGVDSNVIVDGYHTLKKTIYLTYRKYDDGKKKYKRKETTQSTKMECRCWAQPCNNLHITIINHSNYIILNVPTPENITGIKIAATSENTTAIYEKHTHCLKLNTSKSFMTCDLIDCEYHKFAEIIPFGHDSYLLQYEPDYDINVTLYTPFSTIGAIVELNKTNAEPINTDLKYDTIWDLLYLAVPISLIIGLTRLP